MKNHCFNLILAAGLLLTGCNRQQETPASPESSSAPSTTPMAVMETSQKSADQLQAEAAANQKAAETALSEAPRPVETTQAISQAQPAPQVNAQAILEEARTLASQKKYPEALASLSQLANVNLSAEQQRLVEQLRTQIRNSMAGQTANEGLKAVGGLLNRE